MASNPRIELSSVKRMAHCLGFLLAVAASAGSTPADAAGRDSWGSLFFEGRDRSYFVHLPPRYDSKTLLPLVVVLHGGGGGVQGTDAGMQPGAVSLTGMSLKADEENFIVVYPSGTGILRDKLLTWNAGNCCGYALKHNVNDVGFIAALLDKLEREIAIDPRRVLVTGISNGGMMAYRIGCELSERIAVIAPVEGALNVSCRPTSPVSVVIFHGTGDQNVHYDGGPAPRDNRIDNSVAVAVSFWVGANSCAEVPAREAPQADLRIESYSSCRRGSGVTLYKILGGKHAWPGGDRLTSLLDEPTHDVSATDLMWEFFLQHAPAAK
jgi:polyhydroxybutyrate depolymerase